VPYPGLGKVISLPWAGVSRQDAKVDGARRFARESRECREFPMRQGHPAVGLTHLCCSTLYFRLSTY
jgi:hypothetical protein